MTQEPKNEMKNLNLSLLYCYVQSFVIQGGGRIIWYLLMCNAMSSVTVSFLKNNYIDKMY